MNKFIEIRCVWAGLFLAGMLAVCAPGRAEERRMNELEQHYHAAIAAANASVEKARERAERDPLRPIFHVTSAARFINDPNGPVWFDGRYHVFFQHLPFWGEPDNKNQPVWGHASSPDMIHWRHEPIALAGGPEGAYDAGGIASGCCIVRDGVPTIIYTGFAQGQVQCLATSHDGLRTWTKDPANPVIAAPPALPGLGSGFRDPCAWREGDEWRLLVGSSFEGRGGTVLLYSSKDLHQWEFLGPLCVGMGAKCIQWECPTFFPLTVPGGEKKHALIVSPLYSDIPSLRGMVEVAVGRYENNRFEPGPWQPVDCGGPEVYYAPNGFEDPHGRRILWGWIMAGREPEAGWCFCLSLPRVVTLAADGTLRYEPLPELTALRRNESKMEPVNLEPGREVVLADAKGPRSMGAHAEIEAVIEPGTATRVELRTGRNGDGAHYVPFAYDAAAGKLTFFSRQTDFKLNAGESTLHVRLFIDGNVGEAYVNGRLCFSNTLPLDVNATGVSVIALGGDSAAGGAKLTRLSAWEMGSIWTETSR